MNIDMGPIFIAIILLVELHSNIKSLYLKPAKIGILNLSIFVEY